MFKDYYKILGISKNATADIIKQKFRELALKFHPDKNKSPDAAEKFKEYNEAYSTLINPETRKNYDKQNLYTSDSYNNIHNSYNDNHVYGDIFETLRNIYKNQRDYNYKKNSQIFDKIYAKINLTMEELAYGCSKDIKIKVNSQDKIVSIKVPPGVGNRSVYFLKDHDVQVIVNFSVIPHPVFIRDKNNIISKHSISLIDAYLGKKIDVKTIWNKNIEVTVPAGIKNETRLKIKGHGLKNEDTGDHIAIIYIKMPKNLSESTKQKLEEIRDIINLDSEL